MYVWDGNVEVVGDDTMNDRMNEDSLLVEGVDDTADKCQAWCGGGAPLKC